jgi:tRNA (guanine37-N1)-methyltransferase
MSFQFQIVTIFKELFAGFLETGLIGKALNSGILNIEMIDLRDFAHDKYKKLDDTPYGGGAGMVMLPRPVFEMLDTIPQETHKILLSPKGTPFCQETARRLASKSPILLFCGRYEGLDQRAREAFDEEISLGDFILNGGETAAMAIVEAVSRLIPGVLGNFDSTVEESFSKGTLEYPQYTKPEVVRGKSVPKILLSGDHGKVAKWRRGQALYRTSMFRPDLFSALILSDEDRQLIEEARKEEIFRTKGE